MNTRIAPLSALLILLAPSGCKDTIVEATTSSTAGAGGGGSTTSATTTSSESATTGASTSGTGGSVATLAEMSTPRQLTAALLSSDGRVRVFGGLGGNVKSSVEAYDPVTNAWENGASASVKRYGHCVAEDSSGRAIVFGGTSDGVNPNASVEAYTPGRPSRSSPSRAGGSSRRSSRMGASSRSAARTRPLEVSPRRSRAWWPTIRRRTPGCTDGRAVTQRRRT